jgi:hypothetical protein
VSDQETSPATQEVVSTNDPASSTNVAIETSNAPPTTATIETTVSTESIKTTTKIEESISTGSIEQLSKIYECTFDLSTPLNCGVKVKSNGTLNYFSVNSVLINNYKITDVTSISKLYFVSFSYVLLQLMIHSFKLYSESNCK